MPDFQRFFAKTSRQSHLISGFFSNPQFFFEKIAR